MILKIIVRCQCRVTRAASLDHLVGAREQLGWHGEAEGFRSLKVDDQLELSRSQDWQVGGLLALENATKRTRAFTPIWESFGESRFNLRAIAANISELLGSLDKPLLAELPFLVRC